jgi:hypothetical protein
MYLSIFVSIYLYLYTYLYLSIYIYIYMYVREGGHLQAHLLLRTSLPAVYLMVQEDGSVHLMLQPEGIRVWGPGFGVNGFGLSVEGSEFRVLGL